MMPPLPTHLKTPPNSVSQPLIILSVPLVISHILNLVRSFMTTLQTPQDHCPLVAVIKRDILHCPQLKKKQCTTYNQNILSKKLILESYFAALHDKLRLRDPVCLLIFIKVLPSFSPCRIQLQHKTEAIYDSTMSTF